MSNRTLIAYSTKYGSTREVAERLGARLRERGIDAEVKPVRDVSSLDNVDRVVLGMPLYVGGFLKDAKEFLATHQQGLQARPVDVFALGPLLPEELAEDGDKQIDDALGKAAPWLTPESRRTFVGKYDPAAMRGADKMLTWFPGSPLKGRTMTDNRDWPAIESWADELAAEPAVR